jgi:prophage maintenance system killer protein
MNGQESQVVLYRTQDQSTVLEVRTEGDSVWLNRQQMALLFGRDIKTIGKHIKNALNEELSGFSVVAKFATTATDGKSYQVEHYALDTVLSVGYRVKSAEGIRFRQWANSVLKQHLLQGYTTNENRLKQLNRVVEIISRSVVPEISGLSDILRRFTHGLDLLDEYDHQTLSKPTGMPSDWCLTYEEARVFIDSMKFGNESGLFGFERDESFKGTLGAIYQTFGGSEVYPSVQEKAANLLYLTVKNHSFTDGNKRIAAALFVFFLDKNGALFGKDNHPLIDNNALAAATLMIALSRPEEKEIMCSLVMNMLHIETDGLLAEIVGGI